MRVINTTSFSPYIISNSFTAIISDSIKVIATDPDNATAEISVTITVTRLVKQQATQKNTNSAPMFDVDERTDVNWDGTVAIIESVLATMRPSKTKLLANYPNPFNPETWIPYHLANPSNVRIIIYNMQGVVVRRLELGDQQAGYYTSRSRAAHWNGRNQFSELVGSGIYFYHLQADNVSFLRKMIILK